jgi:hypothetical protein
MSPGYGLNNKRIGVLFPASEIDFLLSTGAHRL